jgi:hypothetical protein
MAGYAFGSIPPYELRQRAWLLPGVLTPLRNAAIVVIGRCSAIPMIGLIERGIAAAKAGAEIRVNRAARTRAEATKSTRYDAARII